MLTSLRTSLDCTSSTTCIAVNPVSIDCFPFSARQATAWYDQQLLVHIKATRFSGPVPIQAHCAALKQLHVAGGVRPPGSCLMLHIVANIHRFAGLSIGVPIVIAWTLDSVHSN